MSFNNTFNKSGFTLPSFTNVQPTVGISEVKTSGGLENEDPNKNSDNKSNRNYAETVMETLLEDLKSDGNGMQNAGTPASCSQENGWQDKIEQASNSDNLNLLTLGTNNVETNKSERPNFEDELYEDVKSTHDIEDRETLQLGNEVDDTRISESKQSSNKDSLADTEKIGLASKEIKRGDTGQSESNEEMEMEKGYEKLSSLPLEEESDDCISIDEKAEVPVEEEPVPQEDSMQNPQDNIPESVEDARIADEITNELEIRRTSRKNSIKDIPNPPSNLRKQQAFDFQAFLVQFKSAKCQPVHKYLKSFLSQFNQRTWSIEEQVKLVHEFEEFLYEKLRECMEIENSKEGIEKLVMTRVYNSVFSPVMPYLKLTETNKHDRVMDRKFLLNVHIYEWIQPKNLDLCLNIEKEPMERASEQLMKIDDFKSPRDKIVCILNACKIIFGMIREQESEENADSFVPLLIYVLIQCKLKHLYSNLQYIERFRNSEFLVGETSYYVSTLQIACNFIIGMNRDQLTVEEEEYERQVALARERIRELQGTRGDIPSQVLTKSAEMVRQTISQLLTHTNDNEVDNDNNNNNNQEVQHQRESSAISDAVAQSVLEAQEHAQKVQTLAEIGSMFPYLEGEIVASVFAACNDNAEQTVDALLEMA